MASTLALKFRLKSEKLYYDAPNSLIAKPSQGMFFIYEQAQSGAVII